LHYIYIYIYKLLSYHTISYVKISILYAANKRLKINSHARLWCRFKECGRSFSVIGVRVIWWKSFLTTLKLY